MTQSPASPASPQATISQARFADIVATLRAKKLAATSTTQTTQTTQTTVTTDKYGNTITYNEKQDSAVCAVGDGESIVIIGAAGTGKTTCMKGGIARLIQNPRTKILQSHDHKHLPHGVPGIVVCAYTRRATNNIRRNMDDAMKANCITIHKLLEYGPVYYDIVDAEGKEKTTMRFEPFRHTLNPLPNEITCIIFEESSMVATSLYAEVLEAAPPGCQFVFLGDIQQLPPVFGPAILGFKMLELRIIELTEVYRQALESPIIRLAHRILSGVPIETSSLPEWNIPGQLKIAPWKKCLEEDAALAVSEKLFTKLYTDGAYDPENDMILMPFNKAYGTIELNKSIANQLARRKSAITWEVVAGFLKHYFTIGDKVLFDREDALIIDIYPNPSYTGVSPQLESIYLDYWGHNNTPSYAPIIRNESATGEDIDFLLAQVTASDAGEDRVTQSSHHIKLRMMDSDTEKIITKAAEVNALLLGYCLTVHKAQGSEWDKVFILLHNSHAVMMQRELLYTAVTRAKKELIIICEQDTFVKAIRSQRIKGNTLIEKAEYFKGKVESKEAQS